MRSSKKSNQMPLIVGGLVLVAVMLTAAFMVLTADTTSEELDTGLVGQTETTEIPAYDRTQSETVDNAKTELVTNEPAPVDVGEVIAPGPAAVTGSVSGRVVDLQGQAVVDANLTVYRTNNLLAGNFPGARKRVDITATSGLDGSFRIDGIPPAKRSYIIVAEHDDHARTESTTFAIRKNTDAKDLVITMKRGATIRGIVTEVDGPAISNARVELFYTMETALRSPGDQRPFKIVFTDPAGAYEFQHVSSAAISIQVDADGFSKTRITRSYALQGAPKDEKIDFTLTRGADLTGRVTDPNGLPVANVELEATSLTKEYQTSALAVSDDNGYFLLEDLSDDYFQLRAKAHGYSNVTRQKIHVTAGQINVVMNKQGTVEGWVTNPEGIGLSDFKLVLMRHRAEGEPTYLNDIRSERNAVKGAFIFDAIDPGEYVIEARADKWADSRSEPFTIDRNTADVPVQVNIQMTLGGRLTGVVFDHNGKPAAGAEVSLNENNFIDSAIGRLFGSLAPSGERIRKVTSGEDGSFEFTNVPPYVYQLAAKHPDSASRVINDIRVGEETTAGVTRQDIALPPGAYVGGRALDGNSRGVPFCKVQLSQKGNGYMEVVNTDKDGNFMFENLKSGDYTITLSPNSIDGKPVGPFMTILYAQKSQKEVYVNEGQRLTDVVMLLTKN